MDKLQKIDILRTRINREDRFREHVLDPLFEGMKLSPAHTHGQLERGKDFVIKEQNAFDRTEWIAVVAKVGKITGASSGSASYMTVLHQVQKCFRLSFPDSVSKQEVSINKVFVITNDDITQAARSELVAMLKTAQAENSNLHFVDKNELIRLIDKHAPGIWDSMSEIRMQEDVLTQDRALVVNVLARANSESRRKKKGRRKNTLSTGKIAEKLGISTSRVRKCMKYLLTQEYIEKEQKDQYRLHKTHGLLTEPREVELLFAIMKHTSKKEYFSKAEINKLAKRKPLNFSVTFVKRTLKKMLDGEYLRVDDTRPGGLLVLGHGIIDEELPYLEAVKEHQGRKKRANRKNSSKN